MMKRVWILALALGMLAMCGCGSRQAASVEPTKPSFTIPSEPTTEPATEPTTEPTEPPLVPVDAYVTAYTRAYTTADTQGTVYAELMPHGELQLLEDRGQWSLVLVQGQEAYVQSAFIRQKLPDNGRIVVIDAGHQRHANTGKEPIGPGATTKKMNVTGGTEGRYTGLAEYELNLTVAFQLERELQNRGYTVIMVRTSHDVDITNSQRAAVANEAGADAFIRIHANGSENPNDEGAMTICQTRDNPYNKELFEQSYALSEAVLDGMVESAGCKKLHVWQTDTMSGINWCQVPVTIVEMGYMTNPTEDRLLATEEYQYKMTMGIANGIDRYFGFE